MLTLLQIAYEYFKAGFLAVGGGLAVIPFVTDMGGRYGWYSGADVTRMIAVAQSLPGPFGVNLSFQAGYAAFGFAGGISAVVFLTLPALICAVAIVKVLGMHKKNRFVTAAFYGVRPASAGLIGGAMFPVLYSTLFIPPVSNAGGVQVNPWTVGIFVLCLAGCFAGDRMKRKVHPLIFIAAGAVLGVLLPMGI
jgi:chromate transporter